MSKKNNFSVEFIPFTHFLLGFSFISGINSEDTTIGVEEYSLGFGILNFVFTRTYKL